MANVASKSWNAQLSLTNDAREGRDIGTLQVSLNNLRVHELARTWSYDPSIFLLLFQTNEHVPCLLGFPHCRHIILESLLRWRSSSQLLGSGI